MSIKYLRAVSVTVFPPDSGRSLPAQVGTTAPLDPAIPPKHLEYPQRMSLTAPEFAIHPMEPTNDSPLALPKPSAQAEETETAP
jgi:hypothetical protein